MQTAHKMIQMACEALIHEQYEPELIAFIESATLSPDVATEVIAQLLKLLSLSTAVPEAAIRCALSHLEHCADVAVPQAIALMLYLWPIANQLCLHDVCDGIDNWISERSVEMKTHLKLFLESEASDGVRGHFERL